MTTLFTSLTNVLTAHPDLLWLSEGESPIEAVSLADEQLRDWQYESQDETEARLIGAIENTDVLNPVHKVVIPFARIGFVHAKSFTMPVSQSEFYLLIVVKEGSKWVGVRTEIIAT